LEERAQAATELKDVSLELLFTTNYSDWLKAFFEPCCDVVRKVEPQFQSNAPSQQLRCSVLELLNRLPPNEAFKPYATTLFELCVGVVRTDNQDNSLIAVKVIFDLFKTYKGQLEPQANLFWELVTQVSQRKKSNTLCGRQTRCCLDLSRILRVATECARKYRTIHFPYL
jgi:transformation/transcription domain-associated protein